MSWTELQPIVKTVPRAKAWIHITMGGPRLNLSFSETFLKEMGNPKAADVAAGAQGTEYFGKVKITFGAKGKFTVRHLTKGGARVACPAFPGLPDGNREIEPCTIEAGKDWCILTLPIAAWERQVAKPPPAKAPEAKPAAPHPAKFDLEAYLKKKGKKVTRLSATQFMIDGERCTITQALTIANNYRKREDLPPLSAGEVE